ncbi:methyltransferase domain-containing protein [Streptomyces sp. TRM 70351]|uniref:class I SAM-dependent methyltransferase n=1 Tax=Streptomyces sp. TRM 70351 TaxID=3116552 RepID=UPI002E7C0674|nr:methyltransferase domain-containing protein [Streptomyces sp. TRM 70351]MEE1930144.1 methyltransferase domain-containing protein [Streptomyces sp. TRM 70351]
MSTAGFDPSAFKAQQKDNWNNLSSGWDRWYELFEAGARPVTRRLLDGAGVTDGARVLDIGSGTGQPALDAGHAVGPKGAVLGVDQAGDMLEVARRRAAEAGLAHVGFQERDAEDLALEDASFDAVVSRFSLMFLPDADAVLRAAHRALRPGGRLAVSVWGTAPQVPLLSLAFGVVAARAGLGAPPAGLPGPFGMADPDALARRLRDAGFTGVTHEECPLTFTAASVEEFVRFSWDLLPGWLRGKLAERTGDARDARTWNAVASAAKDFETDEGTVRITCLSHCFTAAAAG